MVGLVFCYFCEAIGVRNWVHHLLPQVSLCHTTTGILVESGPLVPRTVTLNQSNDF